LLSPVGSNIVQAGNSYLAGPYYTVPGPSALLYYQNTEMGGFVARIFAKSEFICLKVVSCQLSVVKINAARCRSSCRR